MTKEQEAKLLELVQKGCTDSDVEYFCDEHDLSRGDAFHKIAEWTVPEQCKGCINIELYPNMPPCSSCSRIHKDHYTPFIE